MTPHVSTIGTRHRKEPITPQQREQIDARFAELQRLRPLYGAYARLRKGGITCAVVHGWVGNRKHGLHISRCRNAKTFSRNPIAVAKRAASIAKAQAMRWAGHVAARPGLVNGRKPRADPAPGLQVKLPKQKFETVSEKSKKKIVKGKRTKPDTVTREFLREYARLTKEQSRLMKGTKFAKTNRKQDAQF